MSKKDYSDPYQDPLTVTQTSDLICCGVGYGRDFKDKSYGRWIILRNFEDLNESWCAIRDEVISGKLGAIGAHCSTLYYNPLKCGAGPHTTGKIAVYCDEGRRMNVGMKLIRLPIVRHDIQLKLNEDVTVRQRYAHEDNTRRVTHTTIFWNDGRPSCTRKTLKKGPPCRNDRHSYIPSADKWKLNVINFDFTPKSEEHGKWVINSNFDGGSEMNITKLWHLIKLTVEEKKILASRMECPAKRKEDPPQIHVYTSKEAMTEVGMSLINIMEDDITFQETSGLVKVLYWNHKMPSYAKADTLVQEREEIKAKDESAAEKAGLNQALSNMAMTEEKLG